MVTNIHTLTDKTRFYARIFLWGVGIGIFLQVSLQSTQFHARLLQQPIFVASRNAVSVTPKPSLRQQRLAQRILRRTLRAAKRQTVRSTVVADTSLRPAAPLEETSSSSQASQDITLIIEPTSSSLSSSYSSSSSSSSSSPRSSSLSSKASTSSVSTDFPPFIRAVFPVSQTPDWGKMRTPKEWDRTYSEMNASDFVAIPAYNLHTLTIPMRTLSSDLTPDNMAKITAKLFYSTRYFGSYDVDSPEFRAVHPGLDLKVAEGTPVGAIGGGKVAAIRNDDSSFGVHVLIEHIMPDGERWLSLYGHLQTATVHVGDTVLPGQLIGRSGSTGNSTAPHLHLQIEHLNDDAATHQIYWPSSLPTAAEAARYVISPMVFLEKYKRTTE